MARAFALPIAALLGALLALAAPPRAVAKEAPVKTDLRRNDALAAEFADVARKVAPSVVEVATPAGDDLGYAVAIRDGTVLLTSRSILAPATEGTVRVRSASGTTALAEILGRNEAYDVALLKLRGGLDVQPLPLGRSSELEVGQWVIAAGTSAARPVAAGVVSALGRRVEPRTEAPPIDLFGLFAENAGPPRALARVIQHDAPIDGTRHGGLPLVDAGGKLVGVNVASAYRGSSFAAPIDDIVAFLDDLAAGRPGPPLPKPGFIGVQLGPIEDAALRSAHGIEGPGAEVKALAPGQPAEAAGVKAGDAILAIDGEAVHAADRVGQIVRGAAPGSTLELRILRDGRVLEVVVKVGERPPE